MASRGRVPEQHRFLDPYRLSQGGRIARPAAEALHHHAPSDAASRVDDRQEAAQRRSGDRPDSRLDSPTTGPISPRTSSQTFCNTKAHKLAVRKSTASFSTFPRSAIIKRSWLNIWPSDVPLPWWEFVMVSMDTAFTEKTYDKKTFSSDPTACTTWGRSCMSP